VLSLQGNPGVNGLNGAKGAAVSIQAVTEVALSQYYDPNNT